MRVPLKKHIHAINDYLGTGIGFFSKAFIGPADTQSITGKVKMHELIHGIWPERELQVKISQSLIAVRTVEVKSSTESSTQQMKGRAHLSPFTSLSFSESKKLPIYCWVDKESLPVIGWRSPALNTTFW